MQEAIVYVRVSTGTQANTDNCEIQLQAIAKYCNSHDIEIVDTLRDDAISGSDENRAVQLVNFCLPYQGKCSLLVVTVMDRIARDLFLQLYIERELKKAGITILAIQQENLHGEESTVKLMREIIGSFAAFEKRQIQARMEAGFRRQLELGRRSHGRLPYGYRFNRETRPHEIEIIPEEQEVIRYIYRVIFMDPPERWQHGVKNPLKRWRIKPLMPLAFVLRTLNGAGMQKTRLDRNRPRSAEGRTKWTRADLLGILLNPFYCGFIQREGKWVKGIHPQIVSREDWSRGVKRACSGNRRRQLGAEHWLRMVNS